MLIRWRSSLFQVFAFFKNVRAGRSASAGAQRAPLRKEP